MTRLRLPGSLVTLRNNFKFPIVSARTGNYLASRRLSWDVANASGWLPSFYGQLLVHNARCSRTPVHTNVLGGYVVSSFRYRRLKTIINRFSCNWQLDDIVGARMQLRSLLITDLTSSLILATFFRTIFDAIKFEKKNGDNFYRYSLFNFALFLFFLYAMQIRKNSRNSFSLPERDLID